MSVPKIVPQNFSRFWYQSSTLKSDTISVTESLLQMIEKHILKNTFRSQDISAFVLTFLVMQENSLIRKLRLIPKFMMLQAGKKLIAIHIFPNISRKKDNQKMKFC